MWIGRHRRRLSDLVHALHRICAADGAVPIASWGAPTVHLNSSVLAVHTSLYPNGMSCGRALHTTPSPRDHHQPLPFRLTPSTWHPYMHLMRLDKPIGTWLLAWPCMWSIALAAPPGHLPDAHMMALFGVGSILLRGAGCTINDLWDRDLDRRVARTKTRPLAAGTVTVPGALALLAGQLMAGLGVLVQLNTPSILLGASSLALVATYPLMKRITYWPQAVLGLTFNWGALLGWCAVKGTVDPVVVLPLYAGGVAWTLVYDTIYAHQDKQDDAAIGVRSTALLFGDHTREICGGFAALAVLGIGTAGTAVGLTPPFYAGLAASAGHLVWQLKHVDLDNPKSCMATFVSNQWFGALVFASIVAGKVL